MQRHKPMWKKTPKELQKIASRNGCKHDDKWAYNHHVTKYAEEKNELIEKVGILEKNIADMTHIDSKETSHLEKMEIVVKALTRKVLSLENEMKDIKTGEKCRREEILECTEASNKLEPETQKEASKAEVFIKIKEHKNKVKKKVFKSKRHQSFCV